MTKTDLDKFKNVLETKRQELSGSLRNRDEIVIEKAPDALDEVQLAGERELAIRNLDRDSNMLRQIRRALDSKSDHTVPEDFFLDMLDEQFSEEESQRQLETAVAWGRYAELFDYDAARRRFVRPDALEEARLIEDAQ